MSQPAVKPLCILIADRSAYARQALRQALEDDPRMTVAGVAANSDFAARKLREREVDVIVLDNALLGDPSSASLIEALQTLAPAVIALAAAGDPAPEGIPGLVAMFVRPSSELDQSLPALARELRACALGVRPPLLRFAAERRKPPELDGHSSERAERVIAIGTSTGGPPALREILRALPPEAPAVVVVQHMPARYTRALAESLDAVSDLRVREAEDGEALAPGEARVAPGGRHLVLVRDPDGQRVRTRLRSGAPVNHHRPSVDVLFRSVAEQLGARAIGVLLTGMGVDGAAGLLEMRRAGAMTMAQSEASCAVFGMPREAIAAGAVQQVLSLPAIALELARTCPPGTHTARVQQSGRRGPRSGSRDERWLR